MADGGENAGGNGTGGNASSGGNANTAAGGNGGDGGAGTGGAAGGNTGDKGAWINSITDVYLKGWVINKGWTDVSALAKSAHQLEGMIGAPADEVFRIPKNADEKTMRSVFAKLGMPETSDKYEMPMAEGLPANDGYAKWMREAFHKAGITAAQAKALAIGNNEFIQSHLAQQAKDYMLSVAADEKVLQAEWRGGYDKQMAKAANAAKLLGFTGESVDAMEKTMGYGATMKFFAGLADKLGEDKFISSAGGDNKGFNATMTPAEAKAEYAKMTMDPETVKALMSKEHPAHKEMLDKKSRLMSLIHG